MIVSSGVVCVGAHLLPDQHVALDDGAGDLRAQRDAHRRDPLADTPSERSCAVVRAKSDLALRRSASDLRDLLLGDGALRLQLVHALGRLLGDARGPACAFCASAWSSPTLGDDSSISGWPGLDLVAQLDQDADGAAVDRRGDPLGVVLVEADRARAATPTSPPRRSGDRLDLDEVERRGCSGSADEVVRLLGRRRSRSSPWLFEQAGDAPATQRARPIASSDRVLQDHS